MSSSIALERPIEGYYVETAEGLIFTVKGHVHPPGAVIAFLRYLPSPSGERVRGGRRYSRLYSFDEQFSVLRQRYPQYVFFDEVFDEEVQGVPLHKISRVYSPREAVVKMAASRSELTLLEREALDFVELLSREANVPLSSLGISGSILVGLFTEASDIDVVVYGKRSCVRVHEALGRLMEEGGLERLSVEDVKRLYAAREAKVPLEKYVEQERRKVYQGRFRGREFFVRFVKERGEVEERYGDYRYKALGTAEVVAKVVDASDAMYTPCTYRVSGVKAVGRREAEEVVEVVSFRGRFCDQAGEGSLIAARGKLEMVVSRSGEVRYRLLLGGGPDDYLISLD
ncbi:MAG: hypothetical protein N3H31_02150 [Candidatus Nezhaarchaeota archaeon]|nr:hypothetical protein [Candidatus Nezhaarchaeota archaeon]